MEMYGTVQVPLRNKMLQTKWVEVSDETPPQSMVRIFDDVADNRLVYEVNRYINKHVAYRSERIDEWAGINTTLSRGYGDCEDYAIAKYQLFRALGFDPRLMWIVVGRQLIARQDHALLVMFRDGKTVALDNSTTKIIETSQDPDFVPTLSINQYGSWVHGKAYRV